MIILGISDSHEAHACIVRDGVLVAAISDERLTRLKADQGYPRRSIDSVMEMAGVTADEIDIVAFAAQRIGMFQLLIKKHALFSVADWVEECKVFWKPTLMDGKVLSPFDGYDHFQSKLGIDVSKDPYYPFLERARHAHQDTWFDIGRDVRRNAVIDHLGVASDKIHFFRHEDCHKAYGVYSAPWGPEEGLVFHIEGGGDDSSASVSTFNKEKGVIEEHWKSNDVNAGRLYRYVTLLLGMLPGQHEFKVMGLAPYGSEYHGRRSLEFFRKVNHVEGGEIVNLGLVNELYYTVRDALEGERFDGIAWGVQTWLEELLEAWVVNNCRIHGTGNVIVTGGVAQNIKACKVLADHPDVKTLWSPPIAGDGSLGIGAAWLASRQYDPETHIVGMENIYLGTSTDKKAVEDAIERHDVRSEFNVIEAPTHDQAGAWLDQGHIIARFSGRMEFGQRALGNRSILADPRRAESVERLNQKIKYRDFWMPFTPSMTIETAEKMLDNPKGIYSPFMTMAFDLKEQYRDTIPAAIHPADKTARPQMLKREDNPGYYDLLKAFEKKSGMGCLMNTSFNLHGDAIVETPDDAIETFKKSDLDILMFDDVAISRVDV